jgi:hypothetical protein
MISNSELKEALDRSPSPNRVTPEYLKSRIAQVVFYGPHLFGGTMTLCKITLDNGFTVTGESACADPLNYNQEVGEKIAYENAEKEIWPLLGFLIKEKMHLRTRKLTLPKTHQALSFFASCIRSGEDWTGHCQDAMDEAKKELSNLGGQ